MLEGVITSVVNTFLGKYVEGLDRDQLGLHLLGGELRLENVKIKGSALDGLHLPVELEFGFIGLLHVRWSWSELLSKPLVIEVRDVCICLREKSVAAAQDELDATGSQEPIDADAKHKSLLKDKQTKLDATERFRLQPEVVADKKGFMAKLVNAVIDNIQVHVRNVHIRYEHRPRGPGALDNQLGFGVSMGLVLAEMTVASTDANWETRFVEGAPNTHKLIDLANFFIYCNTRERLADPTSKATPDSMRNIFMHMKMGARGMGAGTSAAGVPYTPGSVSSVSSVSSITPDSVVSTVSPNSLLSAYPLVAPGPDPLCEFLLQPVNGNIRAVINYKQGDARPADVPLAALQVLFPSIELTVSQRQVHALLHCVANLAGVSKRLAVFSGAYHEATDRPGTVIERERYIELYKRTLSYSWDDYLSSSEGNEMAEIEKNVELEDVNNWRLCAMAELHAEMPELAGSKEFNKRQAHTTGLLATVNHTASTVKHAVVDNALHAKEAALAAGASLATSILPGVLTDKMGLTSAEQRKLDEHKTDDQKRDDKEVAREAAQEAKEERRREAQEAKQPSVRLSDEQRAAVRAEALSSSEVLFLPTGGKGRDTLNATVDLVISQTAVRLVADQADAAEQLDPSPAVLASPTPAAPVSQLVDLFKLQLDRLSIKVLQRIDSMSVALELANLVLEDYSTKGSMYKQIISVNRTKHLTKDAVIRANAKGAAPAAKQAPFLSVAFDANPLDESADSKVRVVMQPLEVIVHPAWLAALLAFAALPVGMDLSPLQDGDAALMQELVKLSDRDTAHALSQHKSMLLDVEIGGPTLCLVPNPLDCTRAPVLVVDVASVHVASKVQEKRNLQLIQDLLDQYSSKVHGSAADLASLVASEPEDLANFYDSLLVTVRGVSISVSPSYTSHKNLWAASLEATPVLVPFDITDLVVDLCVAPHLTFLPATRITGQLPVMRIEVTPTLLARLTAPEFMHPWKQLAEQLEADKAARMSAALASGRVTLEQLHSTKAEQETPAAAKPKSLSNPPVDPQDQVTKIALERVLERAEEIKVAEANPPALPALSTLRAQEAAGFDMGLANSLHPGQSADQSLEREITLKELLIGLKSEKLARQVLKESGAYKGSDVEKAAASEKLTLRQFRGWYNARKLILQNNIGMRLNVNITGVTIALVDDAVRSTEPALAPMSAGQAASSVPAQARGHVTILEIHVRAIALYMQGRAFDNTIGLELGELLVREVGLEAVPAPAQSMAPLLRTVGLKTLSSPLAIGRRTGAAKPFLFLTMETLSPESPAYPSRPCNARIDLSLGEVELNVDPESLDRVACFALQRLAPFRMRARLAREAQREKERAEEKEAVKARADPVAKLEEQTVLPVSERKLLAADRTLAALPEGAHSAVAMALKLTFAGVSVNLHSRARAFATLSVLGIGVDLKQRINALEVEANIAELWLLDAQEGMGDRERAIIWIAQSVASQPAAQAGSPPQAPRPFVHAHLKQHDVSAKLSSGFAMWLQAQVLGLRLRVAPLFALNMMDLAAVAKDMRVLKIMEREKELTEAGSDGDDQADKAEQKDQSGAEPAFGAEKLTPDVDGSKPTVKDVSRLQRRRPAALKQKQVNWSWSTDTPAPVQLDVLVDDVQIELPMQSIERSIAVRAQRIAQAQQPAAAAPAARAQAPTTAAPTYSSVVKSDAQRERSKATAKEWAAAEAAEGHSLIVRIEALRVRNELKDADKGSLRALGATTVRYEHFSLTLGAVKILTTFRPPSQSPFFPLLSFHGLNVQANKFSHGGLVELDADLGALDVALPHNHYVFLMRIAATMSEVAAAFADKGQGDAQPKVEGAQEAAKAVLKAQAEQQRAEPKMLVRAADGSLDTKRPAEIDKDSAKDADEQAEGKDEEDPLQKLPSVKATVRLQRLSVELLLDDGHQPARDSILRLLLKQLLLHGSLDQATGDMRADLSLEVLNLTDTSADELRPHQRKLLRAYRNILNFGVAIADEDYRYTHTEAKPPSEQVARVGDGELQPQLAASSTSRASAAPPSQSLDAPPLLLRAHRLGYRSTHALEVEAELNQLQLMLTPALLLIPKFFALPQDMQDEAKAKAEAKTRKELEKKDEQLHRVALLQAQMKQRAGAEQTSASGAPVGVLANEEEKQAMAPSTDNLLMADALLTGAAARSADGAPQQGAAKKAAMPPVYFRFRMANPVVLLSADPFSADTRGLVLSWALDVGARVGVTPGTLQAQVGLTHLSLVESAFVVADAAQKVLRFSKLPEAGQRPVLSPFSLLLNAQNCPSSLFPDGAATALTVDVALSRLDLNVGFRLYQLATRALEHMQPERSDPAAKKAQEAKKKAQEERDAPKQVARKIREEQLKADSSSAVPQDPLGPVIAGMKIPALNFTEINVAVRSAGVYLNVINDLAWKTHLPFFRLQVEQLGARVHRFGDSGGVWGTLELRAEMYNHRILSWEPVLEPWSASFSLSQVQLTHTPAAALLVASNEQLLQNEYSLEQGSKPAPPATSLANPLAPITSLNFTAKEQLNLNVSAAMLEDLADMVHELQKSMHADPDAWQRTSSVPHYAIQNLTDLEVQIQRADLSQLDVGVQINPQLSEVMSVLPFSNAQLDFADTIGTNVRAVRVQFLSAHGGLPALTIPTARECSSKHVLQPADGSGPLVVVVDVEWAQGVRVISLHSSFAVANATNVPVVVSGDKYVERTLAPGEKMWLPLLVAPLMHTIRVKPGNMSARKRLQAAVMAEEQTDEAHTQELVTAVQGEYGWSPEIVLAAPQENTKQRSTMVDHFSCPPDAAASSSALARGSTSRGQLSVQQGASIDRHGAHSQAASGWHFTCFCAGVDVLQESGSTSVGAATNLKRAPGHLRREAHAQIFYLRNPLTFENVLAADVQVRLLNGPELSKEHASSADERASLERARIVEELTLARGKSVPLYGVTTARDTFLSLRIPSLAAGWSAPFRLKLASTSSSVLMTQVVGDNGGQLHLCVELKQVQGNLRVVVYTHYWLFDMTSLSLQLSPDKKVLLPQRAAALPAGHTQLLKNEAAHLESISLPDKHTAVMFSYEQDKSSKGRMWLRSGRHPRSTGFDLSGPSRDADDPSITWSQWSDKFSVDVVNHQSSIRMPMGPSDSAGSYEIVANVEAGQGLFRRTKMVSFLPRYVLVNMLRTPVQVRQYGLEEGAHIALAPAQQIIWHWPQAVQKDHPWLSIRRQLDGAAATAAVGRTEDWHWSGYFNIDAAGDTNIAVRHRHDASALWHAHIECRQRNGVSFILLGEHEPDHARLKLLLPYCISNRSAHELVRVRQHIDMKKQAHESSHVAAYDKHQAHDEAGFQWMEVRPGQELPFCFEEPLLGSQTIEVQVALMDGDRVSEWSDADSSVLRELDLESFDSDHAHVDYSHKHRRTEDLTNLAHLPPLVASRKRSNPLRSRLYFYAAQDGPTNFLVFADTPSDAWKKRQVRERKDARQRAEQTGIQPAASGKKGVAARAATSADDEEYKEFVVTEGEKQAGGARRGSVDNQLGVPTAEQGGMVTAASSHVEEQIAAGGTGHMKDARPSIPPRPSPRSGAARAAPVPAGLAVGLPFPINPRSLTDKVGKLRVKVLSAKGLRGKDSKLFAKVIFGNQVRQTDAHKASGEHEVEWNQEVVFTAADIAAYMQQQPQSPAACSCFSTGATPDQQHVFVDVYQAHTLLSNTRIGSVSLNLSNINEQPIPRWFELRKVKGRTAESRGQIHMAVWFELKRPVLTTGNSLANVLTQNPNERASLASVREEDAAKKRVASEHAHAASEAQMAVQPPDAAFAAEPRGQLVLHEGVAPGQTSAATFDYAHASVYASALQSRPASQSEPPHFVPVADEHAEEHAEMEQLVVAMMEAECVDECSWSEYSIRLLDTLNLDRVASALMVDLSAGRVVCYITAPLFRRGYSVLVSDRGERNLLKAWTNQDVVFALPDQLAAERAQDAVLRFTFYYYAAVQSGAHVQTSASLHEAHRTSGAAAVTDPTVVPLLLGSSTIPLLSIWTQKLDSLAAQQEEQPELDEVAEENEVVDVVHSEMDAAAKERASLARREAAKEQTREQRRAREWRAKWVPIGTPGQSAESASMQLRIKRREVKMPLRQAVTAADKLAAYAPSRLRLHVHLAHLGVSLINRVPEEVAYFAMQGLTIDLRDSATTTSLKLALDKLQLDNMLQDAIYPVILSAAPVRPKEWMPVVQLALNRQKVPGVNIQCFQYVSFLLQTLDIKMSELTIYEVLDFVNSLQQRLVPDDAPIEADSAGAELVTRRMSSELVLPASQLNSLYFKFLHLQPLAINLTFAANPGVRNQYIDGFVVNPLTAALSVLEAGVGSLDSAPIRLNGKIIEHKLGSPQSIARILMIHYIKEGISQIYKVLGSLEVLGNPVGTASTMSTGVKDFFYEPAQGLMVSPEAFGQGLASGSLSLVRHSISGLSGAVAGVFSSGGKAAAALSLDPEYITRTSARNAAEPDHVGAGLSMGAKSLASSVTAGVKGVVMDPIHGAKEHGAKGLIKGLGTGLLGLVAKPLSGAMQFVSQTSKGIANTADYMHDGPRVRSTHIRAKRYIDPVSGQLTIYDQRKAEDALEDAKIADKLDPAHKKSSQKHEASTAIIAAVDEHYGSGDNPDITKNVRKDNAKERDWLPEHIKEDNSHGIK